jgi:murein DD-endopeptidase MepM/ murein hydrolase activator NlpD
MAKRTSPFTNGKPRTDIPGSADKSPHNGVDYRSPVGSSLYSNKPMVITQVKRNDDSNGYGNAVWAKETVPPYNTYVIGHLDGVSPDIQAGKEYPAGTKLAWTGDTVGPGASRSTGAHLHFEVRDKNGKPVDPDATDASGKKHVAAMGFEPGKSLDDSTPTIDPNRTRGRRKGADYPKDKPITGAPTPPPTPTPKPPPPGTAPQRPPPREPIKDDDPLRTLMEQQLNRRLKGSRK